MLVVVPSRGRPENIRRLTAAWNETATLPAKLVVGVDDDDPQLEDYVDAAPCEVGPRLGMVGTLNAVAVRYATLWPHLRYIGFMGDDHCPRTIGWDSRIAQALDELRTGIVYGNDLLQGERLPTAVFMTVDIVRSLDWMAPPGLKHLWVDNAWRSLGEQLGALRYLPDVVIEHLHPVAGKTGWDEGYQAVNAPAVWAHDETEYKRWLAEDCADDAEHVRLAMAARV